MWVYACVYLCLHTTDILFPTPQLLSTASSTFISTKIGVELSFIFKQNFFEDCLMLIQNNLAFIQVLTFSEVFLARTKLRSLEDSDFKFIKYISLLPLPPLRKFQMKAQICHMNWFAAQQDNSFK